MRNVTILSASLRNNYSFKANEISTNIDYISIPRKKYEVKVPKYSLSSSLAYGIKCKIQDKYDDLVKNSTEKDNTISNLEKENAVLKAGITDQDEIEFICYKVGKMDGDFKENLSKYLADTPKYTKKQETKATGVENKVQSVPQESGVTAILKSKHPELFN